MNIEKQIINNIKEFKYMGLIITMHSRSEMDTEYRTNQGRKNLLNNKMIFGGLRG